MSDSRGPATAASERWTRIDSYLGGVARRRRARRSLAAEARTTPEAPRLILSTLPFAALLAVMAMLTIAIAIAAWPASQPAFHPSKQEKELGTAAKGWFQEAQKEFH